MVSRKVSAIMVFLAFVALVGACPPSVGALKSVPVSAEADCDDNDDLITECYYAVQTVSGRGAACGIRRGPTLFEATADCTVQL